MITRIAIKNFGKHKEKDIKISPHITCLTGSTNSGKSTVLRAIGFVANNSPSGIGIVRHGETVAKAVIKVDGNVIIRAQGKKTNYYKLNGKKLSAIGKSNVPDLISNIFNVGPVNFLDQDDPRFWLGLTPGKLAKEINEVFDLQVIDNVLTKLTKQISRTSVEIGICEKRLEEAENTVQELSWVEEFARDYAEIEKKKERLSGLRDKIDSLAFYLSKCRKSHSHKESAANAILCVLKALDKAKRMHETQKQIKGLKKILGKISEIKHLVGTETPDLAKIDTIRLECDQISERKRSLSLAIENLTKQRSTACQLKDQVKEVEKEMSGNGVCPVCGATQSLSQSQTSTSATSHQESEQKRKKNGTPSKPSTSAKSKKSAESSESPW